MNINEQRVRNLVYQTLNEAQTKLHDQQRTTLVENYLKARHGDQVQLDEQLLEEGWKEIALSLAMLGNLALPKSAQSQAQQVLDNNKVAKQVEQVLDNEQALDKIVNKLEDLGYDHAESRIKDNADELKQELDKWGEQDVHFTQAQGYKQLLDKIQKGYAITSQSRDTILKEVTKMDTVPAVVDTSVVQIPSQNLFGEGGYQLTDQAKQTINDTVKTLQSRGYVVLGVNIESSTDKQRVSDKLSQQLESQGYGEGNQGLSKARSHQLQQAFTNSGIDLSIVDTTALANQGKGEHDAAEPQDPSARYVKVTMDVVPISAQAEISQKDTVEQAVVKTFKLAKAKPDVAEKKTNPLIKLKQRLGGDTKHDKCSTKCPTF